MRGGQQPVAVRCRENLHANGRVVGEISGVLRLLDQPRREQLHYGTLTETGVAFTGPAVIEDGSGGGEDRAAPRQQQHPLFVGPPPSVRPTTRRDAESIGYVGPPSSAPR